MSTFPFKFLLLCLCSIWCFPLSACESTSAQQRIIDQFSAQQTVACDIQSNIVFSTHSADADESTLSCEISGTAQTDLSSDFFHLEGTIAKSAGSLDLGTTEIESFYDPQHDQSYSRFGTHYSVVDASNGLGALVQLPTKLRLAQNYILQESAELIHGSICDIYIGSELSEPTEIPIYIFGTRASFSLTDIPIQVQLAIDQNTSLPVELLLTFLPESSNTSFTLPNGMEYTLSELTFQVTYHHYGQSVETTIPDGFRDSAIASDEPQHTDDSTLSSTLPPEPKDSYFITSPNQSCQYQIFTPEYMAPEKISDSGASFYYFYSETDFEIIEYNLWEDFSPQDAAVYTEALPQLLRQSGGYGDLSSSKVKTIVIDNKQIQYRTIRFQTSDNGLLYNGILVYSWCLAPNGQDVLEVVLWEYNGSDNSSMINPEEELSFAYHYAEPVT